MGGKFREIKKVNESVEITGVQPIDQNELALEHEILTEHHGIKSGPPLETEMPALKDLGGFTQQQARIRVNEVEEQMQTIHSDAQRGATINVEIETHVEKAPPLQRALGSVPVLGKALTNIGLIDPRDRRVEKVDQQIQGAVETEQIRNRRVA